MLLSNNMLPLNFDYLVTSRFTRYTASNRSLTLINVIPRQDIPYTKVRHGETEWLFKVFLYVCVYD